MRHVDTIIIHCSATPDNKRLEPAELNRMHRKRGFNGCGYHFYIRRNGDICDMRPVERTGAHCKGHNEGSIGICYEGGLNSRGEPADTRTEQQKKALRVLVELLAREFPIKTVFPFSCSVPLSLIVSNVAFEYRSFLQAWWLSPLTAHF